MLFFSFFLSFFYLVLFSDHKCIHARVFSHVGARPTRRSSRADGDLVLIRLQNEVLFSLIYIYTY